jgi:hypothetical protein
VEVQECASVGEQEMNEIKPLIFIPSNVKYVSKKPESREELFLSVEERIKKNPRMREQIRLENQLLLNKIQKDNPGVRTIPEQRVAQVQNIQRPVASIFDPNAPKTWIKNLTSAPVSIDFTDYASLTKEQLKNPRSVAKAKVVKHFIAKYEFTEVELNSTQMRRLYEQGLIKDVSEAEAKAGLSQIKAFENAEKDRIANAAKRAAIDKKNKVGQNSEVRSLGAGGVSVRVVGDDVTGNGDSEESGISEKVDFTDDVKSGGGKTREQIEMESLMPGDSGEGGDVGGLGFSTGDYNG